MKQLLILILLFSVSIGKCSPKDTLFLKNNSEIKLNAVMIPKFLKNSNKDESFDFAYGIGLAYSNAIKKNKPFYIDVFFNAERGTQKYSQTYGTIGLEGKVDVVNYMNYFNFGIGIKYLYSINKTNFLSFALNQSISLLYINAIKIKQSENDVIVFNGTYKADINDIRPSSFAFPIFPEISYIKSNKNIGFKISSGVKFLTHSPNYYSHYLPYASLGILFIKK